MIDLNDPADRAEFIDIVAMGTAIFLGTIALVITIFCC